METMKSRRSGTDVLETLRVFGYKPTLLYPEKISFTNNGENKLFHDKNRIKQYIFINPSFRK